MTLLEQLEAASNELKTVNIFRGCSSRDTKLGPGDEFRGTVRTDRKPSDTWISDSIFFNRGIELYLGIRDIRKQALFATTGRATAMNYAEEGALARSGSAYVVQLALPPSARIVYKNGVEDSMDLFDRLIPTNDHPFKWLATKWAEQSGKDVGDINRMLARHVGPKVSADFYLKYNAADAWRHVIQNIAGITDERLIREGMQVLDDFAQRLVDGYQMSTPSSFAPSGHVECIITGISEFVGKVINAVSHDQYD